MWNLIIFLVCVWGVLLGAMYLYIDSAAKKKKRDRYRAIGRKNISVWSNSYIHDYGSSSSCTSGYSSGSDGDSSRYSNSSDCDSSRYSNSSDCDSSGYSSSSDCDSSGYDSSSSCDFNGF